MPWPTVGFRTLMGVWGREDDGVEDVGEKLGVTGEEGVNGGVGKEESTTGPVGKVKTNGTNGFESLESLGGVTGFEGDKKGDEGLTTRLRRF